MTTYPVLRLSAQVKDRDRHHTGASKQKHRNAAGPTKIVDLFRGTRYNWPCYYIDLVVRLD